MRSTETDVPPPAVRPSLAQRILGLRGPALRRPWPRRVLVATAIALLAGHATLALGTLAERNIFLLPFLAITAGGIYGGLAGGMAAMATGTLFALHALLPPLGQFAVTGADDRLRLLALVTAGSLIAWLCETLHRALRQLLEREAALRESEASYRALFHTLGEMVYIQDLEGRFLDVNASVERAYGYTRAELLGQTPALLADAERNDPATLRELTQRAAAGEPQCLEFRGRRRDGSTFPKEVTLTRGRWFGEDVLIAVARDIGARKEAEAALARSEEQLRQAQKMEAIGRLAGGVAHDFNNLLTAIKGNAELAALTLPADSPAHAELVEIDATADRAAALTRQLLAFSRKQVRQPRVLDLNVVLTDMQRMLHRVIGYDVELLTRPALSPALVLADSGQMEQVVLNLVVNARDALPRGGRIVVTVEDGMLPGDAGAPPRPAVALTVRDDGSGMPADVLDHIFEPFFTTKPPGKGTGLGLSTVYGIVRQSQGDVQVESVPGRGTCFRVLLPRAADLAAAAAATAAPTEASPHAAPPAAARGTILLVEDDAEVRSLTERLLRRGGYQVHTAPGGQQALALVRDGCVAPDLLLTDVLMPEMSGPELAARVREHLPGLPVLFVSGYAPDQPSAAVLAPAGSLLEKPFTAEALLEHVARGMPVLVA